MAKKRKSKKARRAPKTKRNSPKMKRTAPKGWLKASAVKIRRRGGRVEVLVRK
jgi:hypothetical protein